MPNINLTSSTDGDLGNRFVTKEYLMSVYPQIAGQLITPELWIWGRNPYGELGNAQNPAGNFANGFRSTPITTFSGGANWKQVDCGNFHVAAIKTDGTLWLWGRNSSGQLGNNITVLDPPSGQTSVPLTTFAGGTNWKQVSVGEQYTAAIKTDGTLWTWGNNFNGNLGDNTTTNRSTPVTTFAGGNNWKQVSCAYRFTTAVKTDGTLWTWGLNSYGQLGDNTGTQRNTPVTTFAGGTNWKQSSAGKSHTAAVKTDGTLWTWGSGPNGQLGNNASINRSTPVTTFAGGTNWKQVDCGNFHTAAIKTDGTLWTWGAAQWGQLGNNEPIFGINRSTPVTTFAGGTNWKQVSAGGNSTSSIKTDGTLWVWGNNGYGNLGNNTSTQRLTPVTTFAGGTNWKQVSSGASNSIVAAIITSDDLQGI